MTQENYAYGQLVQIVDKHLSKLGPRELKVLLYYVRYSGRATPPGLDVLMSMTGLSQQEAVKAIARLERKGLLETFEMKHSGPWGDVIHRASVKCAQPEEEMAL